MKRFPFFGVLMLIPALALVALTGCPSGNKEKEKEKDKDKAAAQTDKAGTDNKGGKTDLVKLKAPLDGIIKGTVKIKGEKPPMKDDPAIPAFKGADRAICLSGGGFNIKEQTWIIADSGGVANVVISLEPPEGKAFADIEDAVKAELKKKPAELDQPYCQYVPHVAAVLAGVQPIVVKNTSKTTHNVKIAPGKNNDGYDKTLAPGGAEDVTRTFKYETKPLNLACSIHGWMNAKVWTFKHPYFAVTKADGSFEIHNVPTGVELVLVAWHEAKDDKTKVNTAYKASKGDNALSLEIDSSGNVSAK